MWSSLIKVTIALGYQDVPESIYACIPSSEQYLIIFPIITRLDVQTGIWEVAQGDVFTTLREVSQGGMSV